MGIDEVGIDKVGIDEVGINPLNTGSKCISLPVGVIASNNL